MFNFKQYKAFQAKLLTAENRLSNQKLEGLLL